jgi:hypothetical protein
VGQGKEKALKLLMNDLVGVRQSTSNLCARENRKGVYSTHFAVYTSHETWHLKDN